MLGFCDGVDGSLDFAQVVLGLSYYTLYVLRRCDAVGLAYGSYVFVTDEW